MNGTEILAVKMKRNDAKAKTVKDYLKALLKRLWEEGESFSGKHPFGNSGWEYDLLTALVAAKAIPGSLDSYGYLNDHDEKAGNKAIFDAIAAL